MDTTSVPAIAIPEVLLPAALGLGFAQIVSPRKFHVHSHAFAGALGQVADEEVMFARQDTFRFLRRCSLTRAGRRPQ